MYVCESVCELFGCKTNLLRFRHRSRLCQCVSLMRHVAGSLSDSSGEEWLLRLAWHVAGIMMYNTCSVMDCSQMRWIIDHVLSLCSSFFYYIILRKTCMSVFIWPAFIWSSALIRSAVCLCRWWLSSILSFHHRDGLRKSFTFQGHPMLFMSESFDRNVWIYMIRSVCIVVFECLYLNVFSKALNQN